MARQSPPHQNYTLKESVVLLICLGVVIISNMIKKSCGWCDQEFLAHRCNIEAGKSRFCSKSCASKSRWSKKARKSGSYSFVKVAESHPLRRKSPQISEHRFVLYEKIGAGPHSCHHCGSMLEWKFGNVAGALFVDHLDRNTRNNDPGNLVPSCHRCNAFIRRPGYMIREDETVTVHGKSEVRGVFVTCSCGKEFTVARCREGTAKYCSNACRATYVGIRRREGTKRKKA